MEPTLGWREVGCRRLGWILRMLVTEDLVEYLKCIYIVRLNDSPPTFSRNSAAQLYTHVIDPIFCAHISYLFVS